MSYVACAFVYSSLDTLPQFKIEGIKDKNNAINRIDEAKSIHLYSKYSCSTQKNSSYVQRKTSINSTQIEVPLPKNSEMYLLLTLVYSLMLRFFFNISVLWLQMETVGIHCH